MFLIPKSIIPPCLSPLHKDLLNTQDNQNMVQEQFSYNKLPSIYQLVPELAVIPRPFAYDQLYNIDLFMLLTEPDEVQRKSYKNENR